MANWYKMLEDEFALNGDVFADMICTRTEDELKEEFDPGYGREEGKPFTAWGEKYVYFPVCYDGSEWVSSVPRNPCSLHTCHIGG